MWLATMWFVNEIYPYISSGAGLFLKFDNYENFIEKCFFPLQNWFQAFSSSFIMYKGGNANIELFSWCVCVHSQITHRLLHEVIQLNREHYFPTCKHTEGYHTKEYHKLGNINNSKKKQSCRKKSAVFGAFSVNYVNYYGFRDN